jgi:hypothetical protein
MQHIKRKKTAHPFDTPWYQNRCAVLAELEGLEPSRRGLADLRP